MKNLQCVKSYSRDEVISLIKSALSNEDLIIIDQKFDDDILDCIFIEPNNENLNKWIEENL